MTQGRKLALAGALFALAVGMVALTAMIHRVGPLFAAWVPLVGAAWVLSRHDPEYVAPPVSRPAPSPSVRGAEPESFGGADADATDARP